MNSLIELYNGISYNCFITKPFHFGRVGDLMVIDEGAELLFNGERRKSTEKLVIQVHDLPFTDLVIIPPDNSVIKIKVIFLINDNTRFLTSSLEKPLKCSNEFYIIGGILMHNSKLTLRELVSVERLQQLINETNL